MVGSHLTPGVLLRPNAEGGLLRVNTDGTLRVLYILTLTVSIPLCLVNVLVLLIYNQHNTTRFTIGL
jgi:hypothetical protein